LPAVHAAAASRRARPAVRSARIGRQ
jgi:hypothetical protein